MFTKNSLHLNYILLIVLVLALSFSWISCRSASNLVPEQDDTTDNTSSVTDEDYIESKSEVTDGYIKYTQLKGIAMFSFEYPESYKRGYTEVKPGYTYMTSARYDNDGWIVSTLRIQVGWLGYSEAAALLERDIQFRFDTTDDYKIIERSAVVISGVEGEKLICSYTPEFAPDGGLKEPTLLYRRSIYLDYGGDIWYIDLISIEEVAEADEPIWEHLIETFKILD